MSFCYFYGIVPVSEGRRVQTTRSNGGSVWHTVYDSTICTETKGEMDGVIRTYAPASESVLGSDSLVITCAKFAVPVNSSATHPTEFIVDSLHCYAFNADPSKNDYDSFLPANSVPTLSLLDAQKCFSHG